MLPQQFHVSADIARDWREKFKTQGFDVQLFVDNVDARRAIEAHAGPLENETDYFDANLGGIAALHGTTLSISISPKKDWQTKIPDGEYWVTLSVLPQPILWGNKSQRAVLRIGIALLSKCGFSPIEASGEL